MNNTNTVNITTTTKHTITVNAADMKKRFCEAFMDILNDSLNDDMEDFVMDLNRFQDELHSINKNGFRGAFKEAYTMMLLGGKEFDFVEKWFDRNANLNEELVVRILNDEGKEVEVVKHEDLCY